MPRSKTTFSVALFVTFFHSALAFSNDVRPIVIAHRGASGYVAEHTGPAKAMAHAMGADFIEQDVVLTADDHPVVLHDIHLDTVTDVAQRFPQRKRSDGRYYAIDFRLAEIKQLAVHERVDHKTGKRVFPKRFPIVATELRVLTLGEEIRLIKGMNASTGRNVGIYPEIKSPAWHRNEGKDISKIVLQTLTKHGYTNEEDKVFVQCFEASETERLRIEFKTKLKLVQLVGADDKADYRSLSTAEGLRSVARYANGVGPSLDRVVRETNNGGFEVTDYVRDAHAAGLEVHPYTFRSDSLPDYARDFTQLLNAFVNDAHIDGLFTDFPDKAVKHLGR